MFARCFGFSARGISHQAVDVQARKLEKRFHLRTRESGAEPDLAPLARDVDFQHDARMHSFFVGNPFISRASSNGIDALEKARKSEARGDLFFCSPDEMPCARLRANSGILRALPGCGFLQRFAAPLRARLDLFGLVGFL